MSLQTDLIGSKVTIVGTNQKGIIRAVYLSVGGENMGRLLVMVKDEENDYILKKLDHDQIILSEGAEQ